MAICSCQVSNIVILILRSLAVNVGFSSSRHCVSITHSETMTVAAVERLPAHHYSVDFISCPLGSLVSLWNFETIRGSLMTPKWQKLASLAQKICTL